MADENYLVIARKWRPQVFEDVVGQEHITRTLQNAIASNRVGHAFLFIGSRGIGKTTTARILAKALNCQASDAPTTQPCGECGICQSIAAGTNIDVIEIDGASNNGVDDVRQIRDNIRMVPSASRYKIYVIDEVHQLSGPAFNALLKTLEEPPEHAVFILATTEAHKIPATIVSRCQRYDFRRVGIAAIIELLRRILDEEGIRCDDAALNAIARAGDGSIRDSQSILEQLISYCDNEITFDEVIDVLGLVDWQVLRDICDAMIDKDIATQLRIVEDIAISGKDLSQFVQDMLRYFRNLLVCKTADPEGLLVLPEDEIAALQAQAKRLTLTALIRLVEQFAELSKGFDSQLAQRIALEALLIRISKVAVEMSVDVVLEKLVQLGVGGIGPPPDGTPVPRTPRSPDPAPAGEAPPKAPAKKKRTGPPPGDEPPSKSSKALGTSERACRGKENEDVFLGAGPELELTPDNAAHLWEGIAHAAADVTLTLGIALGHARPIVESNTVVLWFPAGHARSKDRVDDPKNQEAVEQLLRRITTNIRSFRCELEAPVSREPAESTTGPPLFTAQVNPEDANTALADPKIALLRDFFKGTIVSVQHHVQGKDEG